MLIKTKKAENERSNIMLKRFSFRNCYSFKDETVFSMETVPAMKDNIDFIREIKDENGRKLDYILPVAAIYGKNAGGKSNIIKILTNAATNICKRDGINNMPFYNSVNPDRIFEHKFNLLIDKEEYEYNYKADNVQIFSESLRKRSVGSKKEADYVTVFNRDGIKITEISNLLDDSSSTIIKQSAQNMNTLIINNVGPFGIKECADVYHWCESVLSYTQIKSEKERDKHLNEFAKNIANDPEKLKQASEFINKFDPADKGVSTKELAAPSNSDNEKQYQLFIGHNFVGDDAQINSLGYPVSWESNGTKKILELYPVLTDVLNHGKTLVYDELDIMLHPLVFRKVVAMFNSKTDNPNNAQLIFAAHNTIVMNHEDLRRDEIHIVDKDEWGKSEIFRLSNVEDEDGNKIRMDARYDWLYLEGLIGSTPSDFNKAYIKV